MSEALNVTKAAFGGLREVTTAPLWQYDYGQILKITGLDLPQAFEVHFSNSRKSGETITQIGTDSQVTIPDMYLTSGADIYAFIFLHDGTDDGETEYVIKIPVRERPEPSDIEPTPEQHDAITEAIAALNVAVTQTGQDVISADASATAAAQSATEAQTAARSAQGSATSASASATTASTSAATATTKASEAAASAANAASAKTAAETAQTNAQAAKTASESAQASAESAAQTATTKASEASTSATSASSSATAASASASQASESATQAANSATAASESATSAATSASTASTKASEASASATAAQTAQTAAEAAQSAAETAQAAAEAAAATFETDTTLMVSGKAADAKATGDKISELKSTIVPFYHNEQLGLGSAEIVNCIISANTGKWVAKAQQNKTYMIPVPNGAVEIVITASATLSAYVAFLTSDSATASSTPDYVTGTSQSEIAAGTTGRFNIPTTCQYIAIRRSSSAGDSTPSLIAVARPNDYVTNNEIDGATALAVAVDELTDSAYINYADGQEASGSSSLKCTGFIDVSMCTLIRYSRIYSTSTTTVAGMAFYDSNKTYISGERCVLKQSVTHYEDEDIDVPSGAVYARFTLNANLDGFGVYDISYYSESIEGRLNKLTSKVIPAQGKRVSILGDSISTFALEAGTGSGDKYAGEDCTTNYPGNRVRYPFNDVVNVDQIWWKIVLDYFGWELGINDSWAGSRIAWTGDETTTTGADIYIGSPTRIGHLDDNGTPDVIFVFGGTNDINHLGTANIGTLPTADPTGYTQADLDALAVNKFKAAVVAMVLRLQHAYPNAQIVALIPYFVNQNYGNSTPYTVKQFDDALIECYDYLGVDYIDLRKIVNVYDIASLLGDNLHPNANGMKLIASAVIQKIGNVFQVV